MKKIISIIVPVIIIIAGLYFANNSSSKSVVKIGVVAPLTGGASTYGVGLVKGIEMAEKDLSARNSAIKYELVIEDDGTNPATSASAAQKLVNIDQVAALITVTSGTGNAVKPIATAAKIPHICVCADTRVADNQYNFTNSVLPDGESAEWLKEAQSQGVKTIAIISQNQPGFNLLVDNTAKLASNYGISIVYQERLEPTVKDFNTNIAKARQTNPDLYLIGFFPPQLDIIGKELKDLSVTNIAGMATFVIGATPELFNGRWYTDASLADASFKDRFQKEYPDLRFNVRVVPQGYDSLSMLSKAIESASGKTPAEYLLSVAEYSGKAGNLTKDAGTSIFHAPIGIWKVENGLAVQVK